MREMKTRGDLLASRIAFALIGACAVVRGLWKGLTDDERYRVADSTVVEMKKYGDPWQLNDPLPEVKLETYCPDSWVKPFDARDKKQD